MARHRSVGIEETAGTSASLDSLLACSPGLLFGLQLQALSVLQRVAHSPDGVLHMLQRVVHHQNRVVNPLDRVADPFHRIGLAPFVGRHAHPGSRSTHDAQHDNGQAEALKISVFANFHRSFSVCLNAAEKPPPPATDPFFAREEIICTLRKHRLYPAEAPSAPCGSTVCTLRKHRLHPAEAPSAPCGSTVRRG